MNSPRPDVEILSPLKGGSDDFTDLEWLVDPMDSRFQVPGTNIRLGLDALLGLIPGVGDALGAAISAYVFQRLRKQDLPWHVQARMIGNIFLDFAAGAIPLVGDLADIGFKANRRNLALARRYIVN